MLHGRVLGAFAVLVLCSAGRAAAQQAPVVRTQVDTTTVVSLAISATDVAAQSQTVVTLLRDLRPRVQPVAEIVQIDTAADSLTAELRGLRTAPDHSRLDELTPRRLDVLAEQWRSLGRRLAGWDGTVQSRSGDLEVVGSVLDSLLPIWQETRDTAVAHENPEATIERIDVVIALIDSVETELRDVAVVVLALQSNIAESRLTVDDASTAIETAQAGARGRIWQQDSPPIWVAMGEWRVGSQLDSLQTPWKENLETLQRFSQNNRDAITGHLAFLALLIALMVYLRISRESWVGGGPEVEAAESVIVRPISVSIFLAMIAARLFYPELPAVVNELSAVVLVLSTIPFFPRLLPPKARNPYYAIVGLFVIEQLANSIRDGSPTERAALLGLTSMLTACLVWLVHPRGGASLNASHWWTASLRLARIGIAVLVGAMLANVLGYVALTRLLNGATLAAVLAGVLLPGAVAVISAFAYVVFRTDLTSWVRSIHTNPDFVAGRLAKLLGVGAALWWVVIILRNFQLLDLATAWVGIILSAGIERGTISIDVGDVLAFGFTIVAAVYASRLIRFVLQEDVLSRMRLPRGVPGAVNMLVHYAILLVGFTLAIAAAGIDLSRLAILAGAFGVGLGFGLQDIVNNFVSGLILAFERPIQVGDVIQLDLIEGRVAHIGIRSSTVRGWDGADIIIPNAKLISGIVTNRTMMDNLRRVDARVGVSYDENPERVLEVLRGVPATVADLDERPEPIARFLGFGDSSMDFELRAWTTNGPEILRISTDLYTAVHKALKEAGINIPFPQRDLHVYPATDLGTPSPASGLEAGKRVSG